MSTTCFARVCATRWSRAVALALLFTSFIGSAPRLMAAPGTVSLEFNGNTGGIAGSGFSTVLPGTNSADLSKLALTNGALQIQTTSGDVAARTVQDNALAIQYASNDTYTVHTRLVGPLPFSTSFQSGGIYIGQDKRAFVRFSAGVGSKRTNGERLQLDVMDNGKLRTTTLSLPNGTLALVQTLDLFLTVDHLAGKVTALYRINSDEASAVTLATTRNLPRWFRLQGNATAIPVYAGVMTTSNGTTPIAVKFDWFRLGAPVVAAVTGEKRVDKADAAPGETLTYTITVTNNGSAASFSVVDPIPDDTMYMSGSATATAGTVQFVNNSVSWSGSLATGASVTITFRASINQPPLSASTIVNEATLTNTTLGGFPALLTALTNVTGLYPDLSDSTYSVSATTVRANDTVTYRAVVLNDGTAEATNATARMTIPTGTTLVAASATATSGTMTVSGNEVVWSAAGSLPVNGTATITFQVKIGNAFTNNQPIVSTATIQSVETQPNVLSATANFVQATPDPTFPNLSNSSYGVSPSTVRANETLTYSVVVLNDGTAEATNATARMTIPTGTTLVAASATATNGTVTAVGNEMVWSAAGALPVNSTATITFKLKVGASFSNNQQIASTATIQSTETQPTQFTATATFVQDATAPTQANLSDSTYNVSATTVRANDTLTYRTVMVNNGTAEATNATARMTIPAGTTLVAGSTTATSGTMTVSGNEVVWSAAGVLPVNGTVTITFQVKIGSAFTNNQAIVSTATIQSAETQTKVVSVSSTFVQTTPAPTRYVLYIPIVNR